MTTLCLLVLTACDRSGPSPRAVQAILQQELDQAQLGELLQVDKVNILEYFSEDGHRHNIKVSYELEAQHDLNGFTERIKANEDMPGMSRFALILRLASVRVEYGDFNEGARFTEERKLVLIEDDAGWHMVVD